MTEGVTTIAVPASLGGGAIRIAHPAGAFAPTPASRVALRAIGRQARRIRGRGLDWGSGSGLLAIAAARAAAVKGVLGLEIDPLNVAVASGNARRNGVGARVRFVESDSWRPVSTAGRAALREFAGAADFVLSNPPASSPFGDGFEFRREVVRGAGAYLKPGGCLFLSVSVQYGEARFRGLLAESPGFRHQGVAASSGWTPFDLERPDLRLNALTYAREEERGGLPYAFRDRRDPGRTMSAVEAWERYQRCGESPLTRWQSHLLEWSG